MSSSRVAPLALLAFLALPHLSHGTMADPYLYTITTWLKGDGVDRSSYPKLDAFNEMMSARSPVQSARALEMFVDD